MTQVRSVGNCLRNPSTVIPPLLLAVAGSLLFVAAYPPWSWGLVTGWVTLVPLLAAGDRATPRHAVLCGWIYGTVGYLGAFAWLQAVADFRWYHFLILASYLGLYSAAWILIRLRLAADRWSTNLILAAAWVVLDYGRSHAGFLALPWMTLAQSQVENPSLLQVASLFGEQAVNFIVVIGNFAIWDLLKAERRLRSSAGVLAVLTPLLVGHQVFVHQTFTSSRSMVVSGLGTDLPPQRSQGPPPEERLQSQLNFLQTSLPAGIDLAVLPESALVNPTRIPDMPARLRDLANARHTTVILGVAEATKFDRPPAGSLLEATLRSGAWIVTPNAPAPDYYQKTLLVPFAEMTPLADTIDWPAWLAPSRLHVEPGPPPRSHILHDGTRVGIMICWESLFADHVRRLTDDGATILVMLANENRFGRSAAGAQHNLTARLRAVETRRTVIVSSNMGPPLVIDPLGRVIAQADPGPGPRWATATVPLVTSQTLYTQTGDVFVLLCGFCGALAYWKDRSLRPDLSVPDDPHG